MKVGELKKKKSEREKSENEGMKKVKVGGITCVTTAPTVLMDGR